MSTQATTFEANPRHICTRRSATATDAVYEFAVTIHEGPPRQWEWVDRANAVFQFVDGWKVYQVRHVPGGWEIYQEATTC